jgi:hypothetical protein
MTNNNLYAVVYTGLTVDSMGPHQEQIFVMAPSFADAVIKVQLSKKTEGATVNSMQLVAPSGQILE